MTPATPASAKHLRDRIKPGCIGPCTLERKRVQATEKRAQNVTNKICWINVAVFGCSRMAALPRTFCRDLQRSSAASAASNAGWHLKQGSYPIKITFVGLFDTVALLGLPLNANNTLMAQPPCKSSECGRQNLRHQVAWCALCWNTQRCQN